MKVLLEKLASSIKTEAASDNQWSKIKKELVKKYSDKVHQVFFSLASSNSNNSIGTVNFSDIKEKLEAVWKEIQGTDITGLEFNDNTSPESTMIQFFKTHLIADSGEYMIPLWALNKLEGDDKDEKIDNIYYDYNYHQQYQTANSMQLTQPECTRLGEHNELTQSIAEINKRLKGYKEDKSNLLGQLSLLSKSLYFNSVHGIGKEEEAGATAKLSILRFFDYYAILDKEKLTQVLTPALQEQLMKLRHCIGIYYKNEPKITLIETCMATRRQKLEDVMRGEEAKLASIGPSETKISQLIGSDQELLKQAFKALNQSIQENKIDGYERLPLTKNIIDHYKIDLKVDTIESLTQLLNGLSATEIVALISAEYINNWSSAIINLDNLVVLFLQLSAEKVDVLCQHLGEKLKKLYLKNGQDYISLLLLLSPEKQIIIAKHLIDINNLLENKGSEQNLLILSVNHIRSV